VFETRPSPGQRLGSIVTTRAGRLPGPIRVFPQFAEFERHLPDAQTYPNLIDPRSPRPPPSRWTATIKLVELGRIAWIGTVLVCLVTVAILLIDGYYGYAEVTFAVAVSAGINLT
jgi:hypothetical protein